MLNRDKINRVLDILADVYKDADIELNYTNPFELLIATVLSAQCTDVRVNMITEGLFKKYKSPEDFIEIGQRKLEEEIRSCGLAKTKSKNIINTCKMLTEEFDGKVPDSRDELMNLPGVGRKTANVVISNAFSQDAIAVDTHVFRVSNRIGLAEAGDVSKTEFQLMENIPLQLWSKAHHWIIHHGRRVCYARNPQCNICPIAEYCEYFNKRI